jgi:hypothetical protein
MKKRRIVHKKERLYDEETGEWTHKCQYTDYYLNKEGSLELVLRNCLISGKGRTKGLGGIFIAKEIDKMIEEEFSQEEFSLPPFFIYGKLKAKKIEIITNKGILVTTPNKKGKWVINLSMLKGGYEGVNQMEIKVK